MVEPKGCIEVGCRYLYSHIDMFSGEQFIGCMRRVFNTEVELGAVLEPGGFGGIKVSGQTLPQCQFTVERAYEGTGPSYDCVNPRFFDCNDDGPEGLRAFDLRKVLEQE